METLALERCSESCRQKFEKDPALYFTEKTDSRLDEAESDTSNALEPRTISAGEKENPELVSYRTTGGSWQLAGDGINAVGVPIAAGVPYTFLGILLSPILAAAAMSFSSVSVIANAFRLRRANV